MDASPPPSPDRLRVLAADEDEAALRVTAGLLGELGHAVTALAVTPAAAAARIAEEDPDLSVVVVDADDQHALALIDEISAYASGPVIALLDEADPGFIARAADRGISAWARGDDPAAVQSAIELALRRHAERRELADHVDRLQSALDRRAVIERAKGILMERHRVEERAAFELLRGHARRSSRSVVELAGAVCDGHALLP